MKRLSNWLRLRLRVWLGIEQDVARIDRELWDLIHADPDPNGLGNDIEKLEMELHSGLERLDERLERRIDELTD